MQRDFQSRITTVEQFVNHHKDFGSLTENPHNRAALIKKITDMEVEFQRRITSIEDFLKIPRSTNLEKTSNVVAECIHRVDLMLRLEIKSLCALIVLLRPHVHNDSMDFDHDPKQNEFDQSVADKILIHDFDQTVEWENLVNDDVSVFCLYGYYFTSRMMPPTPEYVLINVM
ncbi:hypothetical protein Tco_1323599 [Tanacetum coccineum]